MTMLKSHLPDPVTEIEEAMFSACLTGYTWKRHNSELFPVTEAPFTEGFDAAWLVHPDTPQSFDSNYGTALTYESILLALRKMEEAIAAESMMKSRVLGGRQ